MAVRFWRSLWDKRESRLARYLLPGAATVVAVTIHIGLAAALGKDSSFPFAFLYLLSVFATAWVGGMIPGVLACVITMVALPAAFSPEFTLKQVEPAKLVVFAGVSVLISWVARLQRNTRDTLRQANEELDRRVASRTAELAKTVALLEAEADEHRKTAEALLESEARVDFTLDSAGIGRWDLDLTTGRIARSLRHDQIFGYDHLLLEWTRETFERHLFIEDRATVSKSLESALSPGGQFELDARVTRRDGEVRWVTIQGKVLCNAGGQPASMLGSIADITKRKLAEKRLETQLTRLNLLDHITRGIGERQDLRSIYQVVIRSLEDSMPIDFGCVCQYDQSSGTLKVSCVGVNSEALAIELAMTEQAAIRTDQNGLSRCVAGQLVYEPDLSALDYPFPQRLARSGLRSLVAAPLIVANEVFGVLIAARRQQDSFASGDCEFLRQLSEHVALAANQAHIRDALQRAYDDLRASQHAVMQQERLRALGQMASGIAHDINNAISPVALYTESLLESEPNLSSRTRRYLETTRRAIDDVAHTVARMREFYRQQEPQQVLSPVHLGPLVRQVLDLTRAHWNDLAQRRGATIKVETVLAANPPAILGIESEIREALTNLIVNAVDAMPGGGTMTVRTRLTALRGQLPRVLLEVTDTGIGMDEETRRRCLEPFFTTKGERGTGLGLAMVYGVVQRHNASIELDSAPGNGTTATIVFPVPEKGEAESTPQPVQAVKPLPQRILLIDDDPLLLRSLCDTLMSDGHEIKAMPGGNEGIQAFREAVERGDPPQVVITDLGMPYADGRTVARAIKAASPHTPVILLTGWGQRLVAEGDVPKDVDRVLSKPPKLRELRSALVELAREPMSV